MGFLCEFDECLWDLVVIFFCNLVLPCCLLGVLFSGVSIALFSGGSGCFALLEGVVECNVLLFAVVTWSVLERKEGELASFYNHD